MSAPFPLSTTEQKMQILGRNFYVEERGDYIPDWYKPHQSPETTLVTENGKPVGAGFTVADMPIEHRWAVQEDGELLPGDQFHKLYLQWREGWFLYASPEARRGEGGIPDNWKRENEHVPSVRAFVQLQVDPRDESKLIPMGYDPQATAGTVPTRIWDSKEERFLEGEERMQRLVEAKQKGLKLLPHEDADVSQYLADGNVPQASSEAPLKGQIELLNRLREQGVLTAEQHSAQVAALFSVELPQPAPEPDPEPVEELPAAASTEPAPPEPVTPEKVRELMGQVGQEEPVKRKPKPGYGFVPCGLEIAHANRRKHFKSCDTCNSR